MEFDGEKLKGMDEFGVSKRDSCGKIEEI